MKCIFCGGESRERSIFDPCDLCRDMLGQGRIILIAVEEEEHIRPLGMAIESRNEKLLDGVKIYDTVAYPPIRGIKSAAGFGLIPVEQAEEIINRGWAIVTKEEVEQLR